MSQKVAAAEVTSPTFVLMQEYPGRMPVYHLDVYRLTSPEAELLDMGFEEMLTDGVVLIEWADKIETALRDVDCIRIELSHVSENQRRICITGLVL